MWRKARASSLVSRAFMNKPWDVSAPEPSVSLLYFLPFSGKRARERVKWGVITVLVRGLLACEETVG